MACVCIQSGLGLCFIAILAPLQKFTSGHASLYPKSNVSGFQVDPLRAGSLPNSGATKFHSTIDFGISQFSEVRTCSCLLVVCALERET